MTRLLAGLRNLTRVASGAVMAPDMAERLLLDQASDFSYVMSAISFLGVSTVALLAYDFLNSPGAVIRVVLMTGIVVCYAGILVRCHGWLRRFAPSGQDAKAHFSIMIRLLLMLGLFWSLLLIMLMREHNTGQLCLLYGVMVGCLATPVMVSPLSCAFAYWGPVVLGVIAVGFLAGTVEPFAVTELVSFIGLSGFCILYLNRRMNERAIGAIRLEENAEVIKLLLRDFEESASDWLWETNAALEMQQVSRRLTQVARRPAESFRGPFPAALLGPAALRNGKPVAAVERLHHAVAERSPFRDLVVPVIVEGEERYWSLTGKPIVDKHGRFAGYHGVGSDITGARRQQEQIAFLARHDSLTKLPNRVLFSEALHQACETCEATGIALLCLDLDNFKEVNDGMGHATGDALLVAVSERLRGCIRDIDMAARLGGDEFAVILVTEDVAEALAVAQRIIERILRPFHFDGQMVQIGMSIGISLAPADTRDPAMLMKNADLALYKAKADGRGVARLYDPEMNELLQGRRLLQSGLRRAVARSEFRVMFQPIVSLTDRRIVGAEALVRWQHPERGLLGPGEFIALAEESGLIGQIGAFVLRESCLAAAAWSQPVTIAVNLSPLQFRDPALLETIAAALADSQLDPRRLELEIVESTMMDTSAQTSEMLWTLHDRGVRIALDDFGTGYSSLSYLRRFPFDKIKIDRSFIRDLGYEKDDSAIVQAIISIAERMGMTVTAEGVETPEQASLLASYGCPQAQGYLFHRPLAPDVFARLVAQAAPPQVVPLAARGGQGR
jgi:diguanylate cyclase (GGDEF)-like protein